MRHIVDFFFRAQLHRRPGIAFRRLHHARAEFTVRRNSHQLGILLRRSSSSPPSVPDAASSRHKSSLPAVSVHGKSSTGSSRPNSIEKSTSHRNPPPKRIHLEAAQKIHDLILRPITVVITDRSDHRSSSPPPAGTLAGAPTNAQCPPSLVSTNVMFLVQRNFPPRLRRDAHERIIRRVQDQRRRRDPARSMCAAEARS